MSNKFLKIFFLAVVIKGFVWTVLTPIFQVPDEPSHFSIIEFISEHGRRPQPRREVVTPIEVLAAADIVNFNWQIIHPVWHGYNSGWLVKLQELAPELRGQTNDNFFQTSLKRPPLYYYLAVPFYLVGGHSFLGRFFSVRFLSLILHLLTVWLTYLAGKKIFKSFWLGLTLASLIAFQPMLSFLAAGVHYDSLAILVATTFIYLALVNRRGWSLAVGVTGVLVKPDLIFLPLVWLWLNLNGKKRGYLVMAVMVLFLGLAGLAGPMESAIARGQTAGYDRWLYLVNMNEYSSMARFFLTSLISGQLFFQVKNYFQATAAIHWAQIFPWYWGTFGWLEVSLPSWIFACLKLLLLVSLAGWVKWWIREREGNWSWLWGLTFIQAMVVFGNDFKVFITSGEIYGIQGRYFFPAILAHMILLVFGWRQWLSDKFLAKFLISLSLILNLIGLAVVYQYFGWVWGS